MNSPRHKSNSPTPASSKIKGIGKSLKRASLNLILRRSSAHDPRRSCNTTTKEGSSSRSLPVPDIHWCGSDEESVSDSEYVHPESAMFASIHNGASDDDIKSEDDDCYSDVTSDDHDDHDDKKSPVNKYIVPNPPAGDGGNDSGLRSPRCSPGHKLLSITKQSIASPIRDSMTRLSLLRDGLKDCRADNLLSSLPIQKRAIKLLGDDDIDDEIVNNDSDDDIGIDYHHDDEDDDKMAEERKDSLEGRRISNPIISFGINGKSLSWFKKNRRSSSCSNVAVRDPDLDSKNGFESDAENDELYSSNKPRNEEEALAILVCRELEQIDI